MIPAKTPNKAAKNVINHQQTLKSKQLKIFKLHITNPHNQTLILDPNTLEKPGFWKFSSKNKEKNKNNRREKKKNNDYQRKWVADYKGIVCIEALFLLGRREEEELRAKLTRRGRERDGGSRVL